MLCRTPPISHESTSLGGILHALMNKDPLWQAID